MKLLIYDKLNFAFKDKLDVTNDYQITLDLIIKQNSYFVTNSNITTGVVGDIAILHERSFFFFGVITGIELIETNQLKITTTDFVSSLLFEMRVSAFTGNIGSELLRYISAEYLTNQDPLQNKPYLTLVNESSTQGRIIQEDDKIKKYNDFYNDVYKEHKVRLTARLGMTGGAIGSIKITAVDSAEEKILSSTFPMIRGLVVSENNITRLNKVTFLPSIKNELNKTEESFYLLEDGTITNNKSAALRVHDVVEKKLIYKDADLQGNTYEHKFSSGQVKTNSGYITLSEITWHQTSATYIGFDGSSTARGVQVGSGPNPQQTPFVLTVPITNFDNNAKITEVKITLAAASATSEYKISVGEDESEFKRIESTSNKVYSTGRIDEVNGDVAISLKATSGAVYISKIEVSYQPQDSDAQTLAEKAEKEFRKEDFMHSITFSISKDNTVFIPLENIHLGDRVRFLHNYKSIATILTKIEINNTTDDYLITLGEERSKLTEKLKIILEGK